MKKVTLTLRQSEIVKLLRKGADLYEVPPSERRTQKSLRICFDNICSIAYPNTIEVLIEKGALIEQGESPNTKYLLTDIGRTCTLYEERVTKKVVPEHIREELYQYWRKTGDSMAKLKEKFNVSPDTASNIITQFLERDKNKKNEQEKIK